MTTDPSWPGLVAVDQPMASTASSPVGDEHSPAADGRCRVEEPFHSQLPEPDASVTTVIFDQRDLCALRGVVDRLATSCDLPEGTAADLVLAVHEVASNSVIHGGGQGVLRWWLEAGAVVVEVRDLGRIQDPMVGRTPPGAQGPGGRGLWLVTQLCDTVQIRSGNWGTTVRIRHEW